MNSVRRFQLWKVTVRLPFTGMVLWFVLSALPAAECSAGVVLGIGSRTSFLLDLDIASEKLSSTGGAGGQVDVEPVWRPTDRGGSPLFGAGSSMSHVPSSSVNSGSVSSAVCGASCAGLIQVGPGVPLDYEFSLVMPSSPVWDVTPPPRRALCRR